MICSVGEYDISFAPGKASEQHALVRRIDDQTLVASFSGSTKQAVFKRAVAFVRYVLYGVERPSEKPELTVFYTDTLETIGPEGVPVKATWAYCEEYKE
jgi:hypothetical protein